MESKENKLNWVHTLIILLVAIRFFSAATNLIKVISYFTYDELSGYKQYLTADLIYSLYLTIAYLVSFIGLIAHWKISWIIVCTLIIPTIIYCVVESLILSAFGGDIKELIQNMCGVCLIDYSVATYYYNRKEVFNISDNDSIAVFLGRFFKKKKRKIRKTLYQ